MSQISGFDRVCFQNCIVKDHLLVSGTSEFRKDSKFKGTVNFDKKVVFEGDVEIKGNLTSDCTCSHACSTTTCGCTGVCSCGNDFRCEADYVIVGCGAAGSVLAARLAEAGHSVYVIEAGPDSSVDSKDVDVQEDISVVQTPLLFLSLWDRYRDIDPTADCDKRWHATSTLLDFVSINQGNVPYYAYPRGCGAGGSAAHHALQDGVGSLKVYDILASETGDNYWKGSNMDRLFKKMENYTAVPSNPGSVYAGQNGWLEIAQGTKESIHNDIVSVATAAPFNVPFRDNFKNPAHVAGIGNSDIQVNSMGARSHAYGCLLEPIIKSTGRVKVQFNHLASKLILCENPEGAANGYKCVGVEAYNKRFLYEVQTGGAEFKDISSTCTVVPSNKDKPKPCKFYAKKEVILCGGAIQSPQLLMLSGIGPTAHLTSVGIETKVNSAGVGSNMTDHCELSCIYELDPEKYIPGWQAALLLGNNNGDDITNPTIKAVAQSAADPGQFSENTGALQWDWHSDYDTPDPLFPDTHSVPYTALIWTLEGDLGSFALDDPLHPSDHQSHNRRYSMPDPSNPMSTTPGPNNRGVLAGSQFNPAAPRVFLTWLVENLKPGVANGTIRLKSADPIREPIIDQRLYEDEVGLERMARMVLKIRNLMNTSSIYNNYAIGPAWEITPGTGAVTIEDIKTVIKNWSSYGHHISGTCQMGPVSDANAVVDSRLRVKGVDCLRVCDTSVYRAPNLHAFNTSRAAYVMGEALAERIIQKI